MYDENYSEPIIRLIRENKISTTEVGDCLQKTGALTGVHPLNPGHFQVGRIHYIYAHSNTNWPIHDQLRSTPPDRVLFVDDIKIENRALFGELVSYFIFEKLGSCAIVTKGLLRDAAEIIGRNYPVWCGGVTPEGCFNIDRVETPEISLIAQRNKEFYQDAVAVCDDCGVVVIPKDKINEDFYGKLLAIEEQEKIWFRCVQELGWDTFDTVCLKKYLDGGEK